MFNLISSIILLTFATYFCIRIFLPLNIPSKMKLSFFIFTYLIVLHAKFFEMLGVHIPDTVLMVILWYIIVVVVTAGFALLADIVSLIFYFFKVRPNNAYLFSTKYILHILFFSCGICTSGMYQALKVPDIKNIILTFEQLPSEFDNVRIAHIADPHIGKFFRYEWLNKSVDKVLDTEPDIIVITGDAVDAPFDAVKNDVMPFSRLNAPLGVYFVAGNHEYLNDYSKWIEYFYSLDNIIVLENANKSITIDNSTLNIIGLTDPIAKRFNLPLPNAKQALIGFEEVNENNFRILLAHRPYDIEYEHIRADLQLSGHTHGGMLHIMQNIIANSNGGYVSGVYDSPVNPDGKIYVSNGMGVWDGFPVRFGVNSEITIITLKKQ